MEKEINALTKRILEKITPKKKDYTKVEALTKELEQKIRLACQREGVDAVVRVEGSVAKDTWLSENLDIDIFMRFPTSIPRKNLGDVGLRIAKKAADGARQVERFAEHPYLEIFTDGYRVDIVPCYDAKPGEWQSATDRTPYHTDYIKIHLARELRGEVRLLKKFMTGTGVYGAEIKVGGFSGYLCELLIMKFGSFSETVRAFAQYHRRVVIDIEGFYADRENELSLLFPEPLVIVDPVDKGRNVASAVQPQKLYTFIGAARAFLKKPSETFFYPPKPAVLSTETLKEQLENRGSAVLFLVIGELNAVPDVLWGQLYRSKRSLRTLLELSDYRVLKDAVWSNEKSLSVLMFELEQQVLPDIKKHLGPPLEREAECEKYLSKYAENERVISGPYIEDGRWMVELPRKTTDAAALLKEKLADGGKNVGVADLIAKAIQENLKVLVNIEVLDVYSENGDFAEFLTDFLSGKPFWLKNQ
ncbi:MAG: CCA tRNA nucleotidyltransferase [Chloroflexi bacterium]|nr:CCA tRNA nucleotidyltransferase [Chloroflexota bacterium]MCL5949153.1 CCA tRNA nucleotidyltransferase [Candidatus Bathyarchaeota archaeon]